MSRRLQRLWSALERVPDLAAVLDEWRSLLGDDHEAVARFLLPTRCIAGSVRCTAPGRTCIHEIRNKAAVYNVDGQCAARCIEFLQTWSFTDQGFIDGGQDGAFRAYDDPPDVPASPWSILNNGRSLRLDWEDDTNCMGHNPYTQYATATCEIIVPRDTLMTVAWSGMGETQDPNYELMSLYVDGLLVGSAHAPGGQQGCAGMGPVVSNPPPPQQVLLTAGPHTLHIDATTNDPLYHFGAWYRFDLTFEEVPPAP